MSVEMKRIGDILHLQNGRAFKPAEWTTNGLPIVRIQNLNNHDAPFNYFDGVAHEKFRIYSGDLLFSWSGTPGTSFGAFLWDRGDAWLNQHIFKITFDESFIDKRYLLHAINSRLQLIIDQSHGGVGLKHITKGKLEAIELPIAELSEQQRIAAILDKADEIKQDTATIFSMRNKIIASIFTELFGDTYTNSNFDTIKLSKLIDEDRGISYGVVQRGQHIEDGVPLIRIRDIINNNFDANNLVKTNKENSDKYKRTILQGGEFLISIRGTVGKLAIVPDHARGWNVTREVAVIPFTTEINRTYLLYFLKSQGAQTKILGDVKGVAQSGINLRDLRELDVLIPPPELAEKFAIMVESVKSMPTTHELAKMNSFSIIQNMLA